MEMQDHGLELPSKTQGLEQLVAPSDSNTIERQLCVVGGYAFVLGEGTFETPARFIPGIGYVYLTGQKGFCSEGDVPSICLQENGKVAYETDGFFAARGMSAFDVARIAAPDTPEHIWVEMILPNHRVYCADFPIDKDAHHLGVDDPYKAYSGLWIPGNRMFYAPDDPRVLTQLRFKFHTSTRIYRFQRR